MLSQNGLVSQIMNTVNNLGFGRTGTAIVSHTGGPAVNSQLVASFGSVTLNSQLQPQNMVIIPNYNGNPISSLKLHLSVTDTTGTTAPSGVNSIENVIHELKIQTNSGINILDLYGDQLDISNTSRYLDPNGLINNSPTPADSAASTAYTSTWDIIIPFAIAYKWQSLKLFVTFNTLASRASTGNSMTSVVNSLSVYASYHNIPVIDQSIVTQNIPVSTTGTITLSSNYILNRMYYMQAYNYGAVQSSSATDSPIGSTGSGITFTPTGALTLQNAPLETFISLENTKYPNTVSAGVGHETGMVNLFTDPFMATSATSLVVGFTSAPSTSGYAGGSNQMRAIWVLNLA